MAPHQRDETTLNEMMLLEDPLYMDVSIYTYIYTHTETECAVFMDYDKV